MQGKQKRPITFAVIGGGHGGQGIAAYLAYHGYKVNLYNRTIANVGKILEQGYIEMEGVISGKGYLNLVTNSIEHAISGVDVIMVAVPASAQVHSKPYCPLCQRRTVYCPESGKDRRSAGI